MSDLNRHVHFRLRRTPNPRSRVVMALPQPPVPLSEPTQPRRHRTIATAESSEYDAFCSCWKDRFNVNDCTCGEFGKVLEWVWDVDTKSNCTHLVNNNKDVRFHLHFSGGTAVIKGNQAITANQHYWEVKMTSLVYGTDMMVGIGTKDADVQKVSDKFCSVLGIDSETWGLSYTGLFHHQGLSKPFSSGFGQGTIIGVHLDMWNGTLSFYKNRQPLGIACRGLKGKTLYPMVSSTAARSGMRIIHSVSFPSSLQFLCCVALRKAVSPNLSVFDVVSMPPGMQTFLSNNLGWLLGESHVQGFSGTEELNRNNLLPTNEAATSQQCSHKHLTCNDCHTPVFAGNSLGRDSMYMNPHMVHIGPILLHRCQSRSSTTNTTTTTSAASAASVSTSNAIVIAASSARVNARNRRGGSDSKRRRYDGFA